MRNPVGLGALCWLLSAEFFLAQFAAQLATPVHDLARFDISLLGISTCGVFQAAASGSTEILCSPLHLAFNAGLIFYGTLVILGIWLTRNHWPRGVVASFGLSLLAIGAAGAMVVGAFPVDDWLAVHSLGATVAIAAPGFGFLILGGASWKHFPTLARWTAGVGILVLLAGLGHTLGGVPFGRGTMERLAVWPQTLWYIGTGTAFLASQARSIGLAKEGHALLWPLRTSAHGRNALPTHHV